MWSGGYIESFDLDDMAFCPLNSCHCEAIRSRRRRRSRTMPEVFEGRPSLPKYLLTKNVLEENRMEVDDEEDDSQGMTLRNGKCE